MDFSTKLIKLSCAGPPFEPLHHHQFLTWFGHLYSQEMRILWDIYERFMGDPVSKNPKTIQIPRIVRARKAQGKSPLAAQQFLTGNITTSSNGACRQGSPFQILGRTTDQVGSPSILANWKTGDPTATCPTSFPFLSSSFLWIHWSYGSYGSLQADMLGWIWGPAPFGQSLQALGCETVNPKALVA